MEITTRFMEQDSSLNLPSSCHLQPLSRELRGLRWQGKWRKKVKNGQDQDRRREKYERMSLGFHYCGPF